MNPLQKQIHDMLSVEKTDRGFRATLSINPALSIFPDHFATQPILPGICMIQAILLAAASSQSLPPLNLTNLKSAKFMHPLRPNDQSNIDADITTAENQLVIKAKFSLAEKKVAEISLTATAQKGAA